MVGNADDTKHHYQAMKLLNDLAYRKDFLIECKLNNGKIPRWLQIVSWDVIVVQCLGQCMSFDNTRILHGRKGYEGGSRLYQGGYVSWDEIRSKMNVIKYKKTEESPH